MKIKVKRLISIILVSSMIASMSVCANESSTTIIENIMNSVEVNYILKENIVIETTTFIDVDNKRVDMWRSINEDGTGELIVSKDGNKTITLLSNQDYNMFIQLTNSKYIPPNTREVIGKDLVGTQYKHVYIASNFGVINNSQIAQIVAGGIATTVSAIIGCINAPAGVATSMAGSLLGNIIALQPAKVTINQTVYEVHFSYDNVYYTHCYHEDIKYYNSAGTLMDTSIMYKQVIGG